MASASTTCRVAVLTLLVVVLTVQTTDAVDCRRYIFAPVCRGISAKRAQMAPIPYRNIQFANRHTNPSMQTEDSQDGDLADYDNISEIMKDEYLRSLLRKYINRQAQALDETEE